MSCPYDGFYVLDRIEPCGDTDQDFVILYIQPVFFKELFPGILYGRPGKSMPL